MTRAFKTAVILGLLGMVSPLSNVVSAQYFGRNKVQYEDFDFKVLKTEHFDVYYYPETAEAAEMAGRMAERWYARLSLVLEHELNGRQPLILYASHPHFQQTNAVLGNLGEGTGGVTEAFKRRIVLPFAGPLAETDHVLGHELVHAFQFDITGSGKPGVTSGIPGALRMPLWFIEGMAEYLSVGPVDAHTAMWIRDATRTHLPTLEQLGDPRFFPYRYGQALWSYLAGRWGDEVVGRILKAARTSGDAYQAMYRVIGPAVNSLSEEWHAAIRETHDTLDTGDLLSADHLLLNLEKSGGGLNLAPSLSPDGTRLVYLSEKDLFSIDMFLADAKTGKILRKITKTAADPHFESLQFINSAGDWAPDNRRFVFSAVSEGQPVLTLVDTQNGKKLREVKFPELGQIFNPTWSRDGSRIAFTGMFGGFTDLYVYDLETDQLTQLTNDAYAVLHPVFSPDGESIVFVTDRFSTDLDRLVFGNYRLAQYDLGSHRIDPLPSFAEGKNINPQWSADGNSIFFIANPDGISNVYRLNLSTDEIAQVTDVYAGVSGITALSPALSSAHQSKGLAFSVYERGSYSVYVVDSTSVLAGQQPKPASDSLNLAVLPPENRITDDLVALLDDPDIGLPTGESYDSEDYQPSLSLDFVSQPYLVAGADRFGTFVGGGASLFWSDMLGEHNLATIFQVNGGLEDITAIVGYENRKSRWNWGAVAEQVTLTTGGFAQGFSRIDDQDVFVEQQVKFRQTSRGLQGTLSYPFNRVRRVEFRTGFRNVTFEQEFETRIFSLNGTLLSETKDEQSVFDAVNLFQSSAALVYDNAIFGATAPIMGQRYRLDVTPNLGSLNYVGLLADYRKYFFAKPFTFAFRMVHFGRYGSGGEDDRLSPLFLGYPDLMRGYDNNTFEFEECIPDEASTCPSFDRLLGTRLLVGNFEVRVPLWNALGGSGLYGFLPIDLIAFADAGLAWRKDNVETETVDEQAFFFGGDRKPIYSAGAGVRINALGFAVFQITAARAFNRTHSCSTSPTGLCDGRWVWQFALVPGF